MAEAKAAPFPSGKSTAILLLPFLLWAPLLLVLPRSPTLDLFMKIIVWGIPAGLYPKLVEHANPPDFLQLNRAPGWKWLLLSTAFLVAYSVFLNNGRLEAKPVSLFYVISAVIVSPVVEEIAFRGVLLQAFHRFLRWGYANAAVSILFLLYHLPLWFARGQSITLMGCMWVVFFAAWMSWMLARSRSLWTCILIHALQNLLFGIL